VGIKDGGHLKRKGRAQEKGGRKKAKRGGEKAEGN